MCDVGGRSWNLETSRVRLLLGGGRGRGKEGGGTGWWDMDGPWMEVRLDAELMLSALPSALCSGAPKPRASPESIVTKA